MSQNILSLTKKTTRLALVLAAITLLGILYTFNNVFALSANNTFNLKFTRSEFSNQISGSALDAVNQALKRFDKTAEDGTFTITAINQKPDISIITVAASDLSVPKKGCEESKFACSELFNILLFNDNKGKPDAALEYEGTKINPILDKISDSELTPEAKKVLFKDKFKSTNLLAFLGTVNVSAAQQYNSYKFPWTNGASMVVTQGWHTSAGGGTNAIDFAPSGATESAKEKNIIAAAPATVAYVCNGSSNQSAYDLSTSGTNPAEKLRYVHIDYSTIPTGFGTGTTVSQGDYLGKMVQGSVSDSCGTSTGTHVHIEFPSKDFVIDGVTFSPTSDHSSESLTSNNLYCSEQPPTTGTWNFTSKVCYLGSAKTAPGDIVVDNSSVLTIKSDGAIDVNFATYKLLVKNGSQVLVKSGGKIS